MTTGDFLAMSLTTEKVRPSATSTGGSRCERLCGAFGSSDRWFVSFEPLACIALGTRKLTAADYAAAAKTITQTVLAGLRPA
ncbi:MAG: hypothetical protein ACYCZU_13050 [Devosia sp.]